MTYFEEKDEISCPEEWKVLLEKWGLKKYIPKFEDNEWAYPEYWINLDDKELATIGMQKMSRLKFLDEVSRLEHKQEKLWKSLTNEERDDISSIFEVTNDFSDSILITLIVNQPNGIKKVKKSGTQLKLYEALNEWVSINRKKNQSECSSTDETYEIWDDLDFTERVAVRQAFELTIDVHDKSLVQKMLNFKSYSTENKTLLDKVAERVNRHINKATLAIAKCDLSACKNDKLEQVIKNRIKKNKVVGRSFLLGTYTAGLGLVIAEDAGLLLAGAAGPVSWCILAGLAVGFSFYSKLSSDPDCVKHAKSWLHITESDGKMNTEQLMKVLKKRVKLFMKSGDHPDKGGNDEITIQTNIHFKVLLAYYNKNIKNDADMDKCIKELNL